jgi:hypothetical protein
VTSRAAAARLHRAEPRERTATAARWLGALALLAVGLDHLDQYAAESYNAIPTIGTLFLLNFVAATVVALGLVAPLRRLVGERMPALRVLLALVGIAIAAGSAVGLLVSENARLFGFMEDGYRSGIVVSLVLEIATMLLLGVFVAARGGEREQRKDGDG